jgi:hypothetical protein
MESKLVPAGFMSAHVRNCRYPNAGRRAKGLEHKGRAGAHHHGDAAQGMYEKPPVAEQASFPPKTCIAYKKLALALIAQRSGSARAASSGPTALPKPRQADKQRGSAKLHRL